MQKVFRIVTYVLVLSFFAGIASAQEPTRSNRIDSTGSSRDTFSESGPKPNSANEDKPCRESLAPSPDDFLHPGQSGAVEPQREGLASAFLQMMLVLGLVLALAYLILNFGLRRLMKATHHPQAALKIHARLMLEPKKSIFLVEAGEEFLLLGAGEREVSFLANLDSEKTRAALKNSATSSGTSNAFALKSFWERLSVKPASRPKTTSSSEETSDQGRL
jgi:flagellar biosynthetic protein FliO